MKEIRVAESAGFCFGVSRSVDMAQTMLAEGPCCSLGQLIHNEDVVKKLEGQGLRVIASPEEAQPGERVLIRAHGVARRVCQELEDRGALVTDATCPRVKAIHTIVSRAQEEGRFVIIIGMRRHPEVEGIAGWCEDCKVFATPEELTGWAKSDESHRDLPICMVCQTTSTESLWKICVKNAKTCAAKIASCQPRRFWCIMSPRIPIFWAFLSKFFFIFQKRRTCFYE